MDNTVNEPPMSHSKRWLLRISSLERLPDIFAEMWTASGALVAISLALRLFLAAIPPLTLWVTKLLIDAIIQIQQSPFRSWSRLWTIFLCEFGLVVCADVFGRIAVYTDGVLSDKFSHRLNVRILDHAGKLNLETLETPAFQDQLERARSQISTQLAVLFSMAQLLQNGVGLITLVAAVAFYAPWLVGLQLAALVPLAFSELHFAAVLHEIHRDRTPLRRTMEYLMNLSTSNSTVKEVKAFQLAQHLTSEFDSLGRRFTHENERIARKRNSLGCLLAIVSTAAYYGGYAYLVWKAGHGLLTVGTLVFLGGSFQRSKWQIQEILNTLSRTLDQTLHLGDVFEFFRATVPTQRFGKSLRVPHAIKRGFEFRDVSFGYAGAPHYALEHVSFTIEPGETIALVGENGAGKTTITKLLSRLYEPTEGAVLLDGIDLRDYDLESLQKAVSVVFQDFVRYEMTAGLNIGFGDLDWKDDKSKLDAAAKAGLSLPIIRELPNGYEQVLGKRFAGGVELSGGEWLKLALSRACMRDAKLLVLDEPSAALDARNEFRLLEHFAALTADKMAVLISHRLPTVRMAHKILVLDGGRLVEQGTHKDLMTRGGDYASMFRLQASGYDEHFRFARSEGLL